MLSNWDVEGILAKQALAELNACTLTKESYGRTSASSRREIVGFLFVPPTSSGFDWSAIVQRSLASRYYDLAKPQETNREQRAKGVRVVNAQANEMRENARIFTFERPFPQDETPYNPAIPQTPRILKLRK